MQGDGRTRLEQRTAALCAWSPGKQEQGRLSALGCEHARLRNTSKLEQSVLESFVLRDDSFAFVFEQAKRSTGVPGPTSAAIEGKLVVPDWLEDVRVVDLVSGAEIVSSFLVTEPACALLVNILIKQVAICANVGDRSCFCSLASLCVGGIDCVDLSFPDHLFGQSSERNDFAVGRSDGLLLAMQRPADFDGNRLAGGRSSPGLLSVRKLGKLR